MFRNRTINYTSIFFLYKNDQTMYKSEIEYKEMEKRDLNFSHARLTNEGTYNSTSSNI